MNKSMTVTYEVENGLYVNVTNRCTNSCTFCIRNNGDGAYGSESLWLVQEPTVEQIKESIDARDVSKYSEIVFCGYGEPSVRLYDVIEVASYIKKKYANVKIRINTNGQSDLIFSADTAPLYAKVFDCVSVSLNASNTEKYNEMCRPVYKKDAFPAIINFTKNVKNYVQNVCFSVVREYLSADELSECEKIADEIGVALKVRTYIGKD